MTLFDEGRVIDEDHPIAQLANRMVCGAPELAGMFGISKWDVCQAMANACGIILSQGKDIPREHAVVCIEVLHKAMQHAYDLSDIKGES